MALLLLLLLQGKQLVSSQLMSNSAVSPIPNQPKKCRMSLMVLQYDLPPAGKEGGGAAAAADKPRHLVSTNTAAWAAHHYFDKVAVGPPMLLACAALLFPAWMLLCQPASFAAAARRCILWNVQRLVRHS